MITKESYPALWWSTKEPVGTQPMLLCNLCVHQCSLLPGRSGYCGVRFNKNGVMVSPFLGRFSSIAADPIEKKPLYRWLPGTKIFSLGSMGCTMRCQFCQNYSIAQPVDALQALPHTRQLPPQQLAETVKQLQIPSVAFTYNEPTLQAEYILAAGPFLREANIAVALVTNGMIEAEPLEALIPWVDALNIDIKTFNSKNYTRLGGSLKKVQSTVETLAQAGKHLELTTLVVPGISDDEDECMQMVEWIASISPEIPLHFSRYFPAHKYTVPQTELALLERMSTIASSRLKHVYIGNVGLR